MTWYVMRDLTRPNALLPAWKRLNNLGFEVFTPLVTKIRQKNGVKLRVQVPAIHDLLFVNTSREELNPVVETVSTLQFRYVRGGSYKEAMQVADAEMQRFIRAVTSVDDPQFFAPSEITQSMIGRKVRIIGGPLNGIEGSLLSIKGLRKKCLLIGLADMITAAVEVSPDLIEFL